MLLLPEPLWREVTLLELGSKGPAWASSGSRVSPFAPSLWPQK